jgi:hypothetical protein
MIVRVLVDTPDCRENNCPTAYLTDHGSVVLQGYVVAGEDEAVEVPERIITDAAARLAAVCPAAAWSAPAIRATITGRGTVVVPGGGWTPDVMGIGVPAGERAVEVPAEVIVEVAHRILGPGCAA